MVADRQKTPSKTFLVAGSLLVAGMLACVVAGIVQAGRAFNPDWRGSYWVAAGILVTLEGIASRRALRRVGFAETKWFLYRASEWVNFALLLKLGYYLTNGLDSARADLDALANGLWAGFFSPEFWTGMGVMALVWGLGGQFATYFSKLEVDEQILSIEQESGIFENRAVSRQSLANLTLGIGLALAALFAVLRSDLGESWRSDIASSSGWHLMLYFMFSLALLSLTQYNLLKAGWVRDGIQTGADVLPRWISASGLLILILGAVALLLPTGYSIGLIQLLQTIVVFLAAVIGVIWFILFSPLFFLINLFASLLGKSIDVEPPQPPQPFVLPPEAETQTPLPWMELAQSMLVWGLLVAAILFALAYYLRENQLMLGMLRKASLRLGWSRFWGWLRGWFVRANQAAASVVRQSLAVVRARLGRRADTPAGSYISLRKLSAREKVFFYYLALLRRAAEKGMARAPAQTPSEYIVTLQQQSAKNRPPQNGEPAKAEDDGEIGEDGDWLADAQELTTGFIQARYSGDHISPVQVGAARQAWERIRRGLSRR